MIWILLLLMIIAALIIMPAFVLSGRISRHEEMTRTKITVICCLCKKMLYEKDGKGQEGISHGYCEPCFNQEMEKYNGHSARIAGIGGRP